MGTCGEQSCLRLVLPERKQNEFADALRLQCEFGFGVQCSTRSCSPVRTFSQTGTPFVLQNKGQRTVVLTEIDNPVMNQEVLIKARFESEDEVCVAAAKQCD